MLNEKRTIGECPKLSDPFDGPYLVVAMLSDLDYAIQREAQKRPRVVVHDKLKPYKGEIRFRWAKTDLERAKRNSIIHRLSVNLVERFCIGLVRI